MKANILGLFLMLFSSLLTAVAVTNGFKGNVGICALSSAGAVFLGLYGTALFSAVVSANLIAGRGFKIYMQMQTPPTPTTPTANPPQE